MQIYLIFFSGGSLLPGHTVSTVLTVKKNLPPPLTKYYFYLDILSVVPRPIICKSSNLKKMFTSLFKLEFLVLNGLLTLQTLDISPEIYSN